jgi:hypothetical protein
VGLEKARRLAAERGVEIETVHTDLAPYDPGRGCWDAVVAIFCHLPPDLRTAVHRRCVTALRPGGALVLEAYTPRQLALRTGGPPAAELMMDLASLRRELEGLDLEIARELDREVNEGRLHQGLGAVVQILGRKPACPDTARGGR